MPGQRHEPHHKICNLRYGTPGYRMNSYYKLEVDVVKVMLILRYYSSELCHSFFSLCVSIQNTERAK